MRNIRQTNEKWITCRFLVVLVAGICTGFVIQTLITLTGLERLFFFYRCVPSIKIAEPVHKQNNLSIDLSKKIRIICMVTIYGKYPKQKINRARTWAKRCHKVVFASSDPQGFIDTLPIGNDSIYTWGNSMRNFLFLGLHYGKKADWFMKTDEETYVVIENLKDMVAGYNSTDNLYFENYTSKEVNRSIFIMSRGALLSFVKRGLRSSSLCSAEASGDQYTEMGKCVRNLNFTEVHIDWEKRVVQLASNASVYKPYWRVQQNYESITEKDSSINHPIFFHTRNWDQMLFLEYMLYSLRPYGYGINATIL